MRNIGDYMIENFAQNIGLSINMSINFFEKFRFALYVLDIFGNLMFQYIPSKLNTSYSSSVFRMIIHNNHCYPITTNYRQFDEYIKKG